jgi:hypothetical protein
MRRPKRFLAGLVIVIGTAAVTAAKSDPSPFSPEQLHPYVHDGIWETSLILDLPDAPPGTDKPMVRRECMTAAKAESVMKQCRDDEDCRRPCRYKVDPMGPHSARIHVSCTTPQGESTGDFDYRWDSWAGKLTLVRDGKTLMGIRLSGHRVGDCEKGR